MCQGLGPRKHDEISEIDRTGPGLAGEPAPRARAGGARQAARPGSYTYAHVYIYIYICIYLYIERERDR